ncbi:25887_t:CDS:2, partial [Gigaspora rosea]
WGTENLLQFITNQGGLKLDKEEIDLFKNEKISGYSFLNIKEEQLRRCGFKFGPTWDIMTLISDLNNRESLQKIIIPSIKKIKRWNYPCIEYFKIYFYEEWSLSHFESWVNTNYKSLQKDVSHQTFFKVIQEIINDEKTLAEVRLVLSKHLKKQI